MTNNKYTKWLTGIVISAATVANFTACSDDHFDVKTDVLGDKTIWQNIQSDPTLSEYADILKSVKYSTSESKTTDESYADLFNSEQTFTVWAPKNGTFNYENIKQLLQKGDRETVYKIEKELIRNNMTRYANIANGTDSILLDLFNGKAAWLNYNNMTIKSQQMIQPNVASSNGVLHIINGAIPYQPNVYEYLSMGGNLDSICDFIRHYEVSGAFDEINSTPGPTIDGKITWVDSVTYVKNDYIADYLNAYLMREDSSYVMLMPHNKTWQETVNATKKYFRYKSSYKQDVHVTTEQGMDSLVEGVETKLSDFDIDSLNNFNAKTLLTENLVFNARWQYGKSITSHKALAEVDSIVSTTGLKFKKYGTLNETNRKERCVEADFNTLFGKDDPILLSNGYAYVMDEYPYSFDMLAPRSDLDPSAVLEYSDKCIPSRSTTTYKVAMEGELPDTTISLTNLVLDAKSATTHPVAYFKLRNLLSCRYDIYIVMAFNSKAKLPNRFQVKLDYDDLTGKRIKGLSLKNPNPDAVDAKGEPLVGTNYYVNRLPQYEAEGMASVTDTILVAQDFEFPVTYYGLSNAYPVLQVQSYFTSKENSIYSRDLWINAIILKPKQW